MLYKQILHPSQRQRQAAGSVINRPPFARLQLHKKVGLSYACKESRCLRPRKPFCGNRTKKFHVKHF
jgi:hypothetical protein